MQHEWILGQSKTGKSTLLQYRAIDAIKNGHGVFYLCPHRPDYLLTHIPKKRLSDVMIFDPSDEDYPIAFNPLETGDSHTADTITETLNAIWGYSDVPTPQMEQMIYNSAAAMIDMPGGTFLGMYYLMINAQYRKRVLKNIKDTVVLSFWEEYHRLPLKEQILLNRSTLNKVQMIIADRRLRNIFGQTRSRLYISDVLEKRQILIVVIPIATFGKTKVGSIGAMLLAQLLLCLHKNNNAFHAFIDDAHYFQTPILTMVLKLAAQYQVYVTVVSSYLTELDKRYTDAFMGLITNVTAFKMGINDGVYLSKALGIPVNNIQLHEQSLYEMYVITPDECFDATLTKRNAIRQVKLNKLVKLSRRQWASQRKRIEPKINAFMEKMK